MATPIQMTPRGMYLGRSISKKYRGRMYHSPAVIPTPSKFAFLPSQARALAGITQAQPHLPILSLIQFGFVFLRLVACHLLAVAPIRQMVAPSCVWLKAFKTCTVDRHSPAATPIHWEVTLLCVWL